jgi:hypothetical protein
VYPELWQTPFLTVQIWCWVSSDVEWMRIAFFYAPVWLGITLTLIIYIVTGRKIFKKRSELRSFTKKATVEQETQGIANPFTTGEIVVETEMKVTHSALDQELEAASPTGSDESRSSFASTNQLADTVEPTTIQVAAPSSFSAANWGKAIPSSDTIKVPADNTRTGRTGYRATAFSTNKTQGLVTVTPRSVSIGHQNPSRRRHAAMEGNAAAWGYFKVAFLMFAALFVVWVPSTVNRLQQFINKDKAIFGLNLASALVLPLQGFWNAMIYTSTTWPECKRAFAETMDAISRGNRSERRIPYGKGSDHTLTASGNQEFSVIPLDTVLNPSESQQHLQSVSSTDTMRIHPDKANPQASTGHCG